jgi:hypothetical protein
MEVMDRDKMREEIAKMLFDWIDDDGWEWYEVDKEVRDHYRGKVDSILSHLDAQRCEWKDDGYGDYAAQCGGYFSFDHDIVDDKYCPCCGRRIEVKDGQG